MPIILFPCVFIDSFSTLLIPEFSRYYAKKDYKRIRQITKLILILTAIFSIFLTIILLLFAEDLSVFIYKDIEISIYLRLLCPVILFIYIDIVIDSILKGLNEQVNVMFVNVVDLVVSVVFIYYFVPKLGFYGYIASIFISEILNFVLSSLRLYKVLSL